MSDEKLKTHGLILDNRKSLHLSGICDVSSFDDTAVIMDTEMGELTVKGRDLHILGFNRETGDLSIEGYVYLLGYNDQDKKNHSFLGRLLK